MRVVATEMVTTVPSSSGLPRAVLAHPSQQNGLHTRHEVLAGVIGAGREAVIHYPRHDVVWVKWPRNEVNDQGLRNFGLELRNGCYVPRRSRQVLDRKDATC